MNREVEAVRSALVEVSQVLGGFRDHLVVVGGWAPELMFPDKGHIGSLDVDIAVAPTALASNVYESVMARLIAAGYSHNAPPTRFTKQIFDCDAPVKIDLIAGQYQTGEKRETIQVDELQVNTLRGLDLAFEASREIKLNGVMPDGAENIVTVRVVEPAAFLLIKAFAMDERDKPKDAYDVSFVIQHSNLKSLAAELSKLVENDLAAVGFEIFKDKFETVNSIGPSRAADVLAENGDDFEASQRDAFEYAQELIRLVEN